MNGVVILIFSVILIAILVLSIMYFGTIKKE
jgi:hypothetical protein